MYCIEHINSLNSIILVYTMVQGDMPDVHLTYNSACTSEACLADRYFLIIATNCGLKVYQKVVELIFGIEQHLMANITRVIYNRFFLCVYNLSRCEVTQ